MTRAGRPDRPHWDTAGTGRMVKATPLLAGEGDDWRMAFYFRRRFEAANLAWEGKVGLLRLRRDDGAVV